MFISVSQPLPNSTPITKGENTAFRTAITLNTMPRIFATIFVHLMGLYFLEDIRCKENFTGKTGKFTHAMKSIVNRKKKLIFKGEKAHDNIYTS